MNISLQKVFYCILLAIVLLAITGGFFTLHQTKQVVITRFGDPIRIIKDPGLYVKIPALEEATFFENRLLSIDLQALEVTLGDKRRIIVDAFVRYKICDPLKFYQSVYNEKGVVHKLNPVVLGSLHSVLGSLGLNTMLSDARISVMNKIRDTVNQAAQRFGINVVDVRIRKTDLPQQNSKSIENRMISERDREAKEIRAKGLEIAQTIKSTADRDSAIAIAEADAKVAKLIAAGETEANKIYSNAFSKDKKFFEFYKSLDAYKTAFSNPNTTFVIAPKGDFFKYMNENN